MIYLALTFFLGHCDVHHIRTSIINPPSYPHKTITKTHIYIIQIVFGVWVQTGDGAWSDSILICFCFLSNICLMFLSDIIGLGRKKMA